MPIPPPGAPRAVTGRQLHMLARAVRLADPTITSGEWKDRLYDRLIVLGFDYPRPDRLTTAMSSVERQLTTGGQFTTTRTGRS